MILYQLRCDNDHAFEGWFPSSKGFENQAARRLIACPACGSDAVQRAMMAPAVRTRRAATPPVVTANGAPEMALPDAVRAVLQRLRGAIERECDDMGDRFADEAIRMHRGEAPERGIYGQASEADREALADEGVDVVRIPWLRPAES